MRQSALCLDDGLQNLHNARMTQSPHPHNPLDDVRLSQLFSSVLDRYEGQTVTVGTLVEALHERGFGVLLILFSLPLCIPIPKPPPLDTILGLPLFYLSLQMILGRDRPALPQKILNKPLPVDILIKAFRKSRTWMERFEKLFRPRLTRTLPEHRLARICGCLGMGLTCSVLVPFPLSNTVPSLCMVVMATGLISRDGVAAIAAGIFGTAWVVMLAVLAALGGSWLIHLI